jgi:glycosyltransferase involved in cell wall biosynthesis
VLLLLKIDHRAPGNPLPELAALLPDPSPPVALLYNQALSAARMAELYRSADCFVLPTRGEGWGMPILEAMACGVPAITTAWSAPTAFVNAQNGYLLPFRMQPADQHQRYLRGAQWAEPNQDTLTDLLRQVAGNPTERIAKGQQAAQDAFGWTWERAVNTVIQRLAGN